MYDFFHSVLLAKVKKKNVSILLLDNYDSFTYNLYHYCQLFSDDIEVRRNDAIELAEVDRFDKILLSPGPGLPDEAGIMPELIEAYHNNKSIFGVCLGLQAIAEYYGAELRNLDSVIHGKQSQLAVIDRGDRLFKGLPDQLRIGHYHSWVVDENSVP